MNAKERKEALARLRALEVKQNEIAKCTSRMLTKHDKGRLSIDKGTHK